MTKKQIEALFQAIEDGRLRAVAQWLAEDSGAVDVIGCGKQAFLGKTPLMFALQAGNSRIARFLLKRGANVNATQTEGWRWPRL